jgi:hypothetical protein
VQGSVTSIGFDSRPEKDQGQRNVPGHPRLFGIVNIGVRGQHPKGCAEQILARGDPGHRLDIDRMDGEQAGDRG